MVANYNGTNDGITPQSADRQYPAMPDVEQGDKPSMITLGATGTRIFSGIIDDASTGELNPDFFWRNGIEIFDDMLHSDGMIKAIRVAIEQPIRSAKWSIEPGAKDDDADDKQRQQAAPQMMPAQPQQPQQPQAATFDEFGTPQSQPLPQPQQMPPTMPAIGQPQQSPMQPQPDEDDDPEAARNEEIAAFVQSCLFDDLCSQTAAGHDLYQTWDEILRHILLHLWYGFSLFEINWREEDGWIKLARLTPLLPRTIWRWWVGPDTELEGIQQWTFRNYTQEYVNIPVGKLLRFTCQQEGNDFEGVSLLRAIYKHWWFISQYEKVQAIGIERDAVAFPFVFYPDGASDSDKQAAQHTVSNMRANENMGGVLPETWRVEFPANHPQLTTDQIGAAIDHHDQAIGRSVLANFLNQGSTKYGSRGVDKSQGTRFLAAQQSVCEYIEDIVNVLIRQLVDYNYTDVSVYPKLKCSKLVSQDLENLALAMQQLTSGASPILHPTPEDEDFLRDAWGLPSAPKGAVEGTNPGSPANGMQPDPNAAGINGQQDAQQQQMPQMQAAPQQAQRQTAGGDDAGAAATMGELSESVRLLAETYAAIMSADAVDGALTFMNPNHRGRGSGGGQFTRKGLAGASGPSAGRTSGGGGGRGRDVGGMHGSRGSGREGGTGGRGGTTHGGGGGGSSSHGEGGEGSRHASTKAKTEGEKVPTGRRARAPKAEGESTSRSSRGRSTNDEAHNGGHRVMTPEERAAAGLKAEVNPHTLPTKDGHVDVSQLEAHYSGTHQIDIAGEVNPHGLAQAFGEHQLAAVLSVYSHGRLKEAADEVGVKPGRTKEDTIARITQHVTEGRYSGRFTKAEGGNEGGARRSSRAPKAEGESTSRSSRGTRAKGETSGGKRGGGKAAKVAGVAKLTPIGHVHESVLDPYAHGSLKLARGLRTLYGVHQLRAALSVYSHAELKYFAHDVSSHFKGTRPASWSRKQDLIDYVYTQVAGETGGEG